MPAMTPQPGSLPDAMIRQQEVLADLERAREIAVHLEQQLAHVTGLAAALARDLAEMHAAEAIDLDRWPTARALVSWSQEQQP